MFDRTLVCRFFRQSILAGIMVLGMSPAAAFAGNGYVYAGGANSAAACGGIATLVRSSHYRFGPGYDDDGRYYPYWNACFVSVQTRGRAPNNPVQPNPRPQPTQPNAATACKDINRMPATLVSFQTVSMHTPGYESLHGPHYYFQEAINDLIDRCRDGMSMQILRGAYQSASSRFGDLANAFYPVHRTQQNLEADKRWKELANEMTRIDRHFQ